MRQNMNAEIEPIAEAAGFTTNLFGQIITPASGDVANTALTTFAELLRAAEREWCASIAENYDLGTTDGHAIAACIRGA